MITGSITDYYVVAQGMRIAVTDRCFEDTADAFAARVVVIVFRIRLVSDTDGLVSMCSAR